MSQARPMKGFRGFLKALVSVVLFPLLWLRALRFARARREDDARGPAKVAIAIVASVLLLVVVGGAVWKFRESSIDGIYDQLDTRLVSATGEASYREAQEVVRGRTETIAKLAAARGNNTDAYDTAGPALLSDENRTALAPLRAAVDDLITIETLEGRAVAALAPQRQGAWAEARGDLAKAEAKLDAAREAVQLLEAARAAAVAAEAATHGSEVPADQVRNLRAQADIQDADNKLVQKRADLAKAKAAAIAARAATDAIVDEGATLSGDLAALQAARASLAAHAREAGLGADLDAGVSAETAAARAFADRFALALSAAAGAEPTKESASKLKDAGNAMFALGTAMQTGRIERADAQARIEDLGANHRFYEDQVKPLVAARDDAGIRAAIAGSGIDHEGKTAGRTAFAFKTKDDAVKDMDQVLWLFVYPSVAGLFLAPIVFAMGSILRAGHVPSDTVGFKPYPGGAMGWFLLLGGFGIPSIPFAAWAVKDIEDRAAEGQIAL